MIRAAAATPGGVKSIKREWLDKVAPITRFDLDYYAERLVETAIMKNHREMKCADELRSISK